MPVLGLDIGKIVKWGAILIGVVAIILFLLSWRDQGQQITTLENDLNKAKIDLKAAEDQLKESTRVTDVGARVGETRDARRENNITAFDNIANEFNERVQQERDSELRNLPSEPPEKGPALPPIPLADLEAPPAKLEPQIPPAKKSTQPPSPTPAAEKISQLAIDAAWSSYCQALNPKPEGCQ